MLTTAHFTATEIPGTVAIFLLGVAVGFALLQRRTLWLPITVILAFTALATIAGSGGWPAGVEYAIDLAALGLAMVCVALLLAATRRSRGTPGAD